MRSVALSIFGRNMRTLSTPQFFENHSKCVSHFSHSQKFFLFCLMNAEMAAKCTLIVCALFLLFFICCQTGMDIFIPSVTFSNGIEGEKANRLFIVSNSRCSIELQPTQRHFIVTKQKLQKFQMQFNRTHCVRHCIKKYKDGESNSGPTAC